MAGLTSEHAEAGREPLRRCLICRQSLPKQLMLRLVVDAAGEVWPDLLQKAPGRGVYHCLGDDCLKQTNDKRLQALRKDFPQAVIRWESLRERLLSLLSQQMQGMIERQRMRAAVGRDAVMHRMWNNAPLLILLAEDAGEALQRQIRDAAGKRQAAGQPTMLANVLSVDWLGGALHREQVAVVGLEGSATTEKLERYCAWYGRLKGIGVR
ncbi:MAG TPA: YlxR family protein [Mariprofundaceae bacterium]|nr:YlxR family protein [Mariprofundaceae bacterium]